MLALVACVLSINVTETENSERFIVKRQTDEDKPQDSPKVSSDRRTATTYEDDKYDNTPPKFVRPVPIEDVLGYKPV